MATAEAPAVFRSLTALDFADACRAEPTLTGGFHHAGSTVPGATLLVDVQVLAGQLVAVNAMGLL